MSPDVARVSCVRAAGWAATGVAQPTLQGLTRLPPPAPRLQLLESSKTAEKMYKLDEHLACAVAGITSDANILINNARVTAQRYTFTYGEPMPVEQLVQSLCDTKQGYTQFGGLRPFGVSFLFVGWDAVHGYQLYQSDPSGNYGGWKATAIGANSGAAQSILKADYRDDLTLAEALQLAVKVLSKTMDSTQLAADKLELTSVSRAPSGEITYHIYSQAELEPITAAVNAAAAAEEAAKNAEKKQ